MDFFKDFVIGYCHEASNAISRDERLAIGCLILDHQMPLMEDAYYLEAQVLQFLAELANLKKPNLTETVFQLYSLCFSDEYLRKWTMYLVHFCCKKLIQ